MAEHGTSNKKNETNSQYLFLMDAWTIFFLRRWVRTQTDRKWISACRFSVRYFCQTELTSWFTKRVRMGLFFKKIVDSTLLPFAMFMFKMLNWIIITCDSPFSFQIKSNISLWSFMDFSNCKWPVKFGQYSFHNFQLIFYQEKFFYKWPAVFKSIRIFPKKKQMLQKGYLAFNMSKSNEFSSFYHLQHLCCANFVILHEKKKFCKSVKFHILNEFNQFEHADVL